MATTKLWYLYKSPIAVGEAADLSLRAIERRMSAILNDKSIPPSLRLRLYRTELAKFKGLRDAFEQKSAMRLSEAATEQQPVSTKPAPAARPTSPEESVTPAQRAESEDILDETYPGDNGEEEDLLMSDVGDDDAEHKNDADDKSWQPAPPPLPAAAVYPAAAASSAQASGELPSRATIPIQHGPIFRELGVIMPNTKAQLTADHLLTMARRAGIGYNEQREIEIGRLALPDTHLGDVIKYLSSPTGQTETAPAGTKQILERLIASGQDMTYVKNKNVRPLIDELATVLSPIHTRSRK